MELIKNSGGRKNFCFGCRNKGRIKVVQECDREKFEREYDRLDAPGTMAADLVYDKAIEECRFDYYYCPCCEEGQKYKDKYPVYIDNSTYTYERDRLYDELLECKLKLKDAEKKEIQIMEKYSKEKRRELNEIQKEVNELSAKYVEARNQFMDFVKKLD